MVIRCFGKRKRRCRVFDCPAGIICVLPGRFINMGNRTHRVLKWAFFILYMIVLIYLVFFAESMGRTGHTGYVYNLRPFREIKRYWKYLGRADRMGMIALLNIVGNILAFVPFGIFVPLLSDGKCQFVAVFFSTFCMTLSIELLQLITKVGTFDVDDILLNCVGGVLGYCLYAVARAFRNRLKRRDRTVV